MVLVNFMYLGDQFTAMTVEYIYLKDKQKIIDLVKKLALGYIKVKPKYKPTELVDYIFKTMRERGYGVSRPEVHSIDI